MASLAFSESDLRRLFDVARHVNEETTFERLLPRILDSAIEAVAAQRGFLALLDGERPVLRVSRNLDREDLDRESMEISDHVLESVLRTGEAVVSTRAPADGRFSGYESVRTLGLEAVYCVPLRAGERTVGALYLDSRVASPVDLRRAPIILELLAEHASVALQKARDHEELQRRSEALAASLARIEEFNRHLEGRVASQAREIRTFEGVLAQEHAELAARFPLLLGDDPSLHEVRRAMDRAARVGYPVLILGESGTGKEVVARSIHASSARSRREMVRVNCSAFAPGLMDAQLFGHARGAFTGADRARRGFLEAAHHGTLFLDEFGDLPPDAQAKLLRVVECGEIHRVGEETPTPVDARLILATNRDLPRLVREGRFREDLYFRLDTITIRLPPVRERRRDIAGLARHFLCRAAREVGAAGEMTFDDAALAVLEAHDWPGNVREILSVVRRAALTASGPVVRAADLTFEGPAAEARPLPASRRADLPGDLLPRVRAALDRLAPTEVLTFRRYRALARVSRATAARDLADLVRRGMFEKSGRTASVVYRPRALPPASPSHA